MLCPWRTLQNGQIVECHRTLCVNLGCERTSYKYVRINLKGPEASECQEEDKESASDYSAELVFKGLA